MDCIICFDKVHNKYLQCMSEECNVKMCKECFGDYLKNLISEGIFSKYPHCVGRNCMSTYKWSDVPKEYKSDFERIVENWIKGNTKADVALAKKRIVDQMRNKRLEIVKTTFPPVIALAAEKYFADKIRALESKIRKQQEKSMAKELNKLCMISACNGPLDSNFKCTLCQTEYCSDCEAIKKEGHICKQEDIETVSFIRGMVHCPECHLPVERSYGCNNITCASCNTNFNYETQKHGGYGSNVQSVETRNIIRLGDIVHCPSKKLSHILSIIDQNSSNMVRPKIKTMENVMIRYKAGKCDIQTVCRVMETYYKIANKYSLYIKRITMAEELLRKEKNEKELTKLLVKLFNLKV